MAVVEDSSAPPPKVEVRPRGASRREAWQRRLPLLPALIYTIVVTQIPFLVTLWYSFQNYFFDVPGGAHFTGLSNYKTVFTNAAFRGALCPLGGHDRQRGDRGHDPRGGLRGAAGPQVHRPQRGPDADHHPVPDHARGRRAGVGRADAGPELRAAELPAAAVRRAPRGLAVHARAGLGDRGHDLAVDPVHDPDRAGRPAEPASRRAGGGQGRRGRGAGHVPRADPARTCGRTSSWASCSARSTWSTCSTRSG